MRVEAIVKGTGTVYVKMRGECGTCAASAVTMKMGIEKVLKERIVEVIFPLVLFLFCFFLGPSFAVSTREPSSHKFSYGFSFICVGTRCYSDGIRRRLDRRC